MAIKRTITIPDIRIPKGITLTHILGLLLVVAAFFLGSLYTKVQILENGGTTTNTAAAPAAAAGAQAGTVPTAPGAKVDVGIGHFPIKGNANAKVTLIEFADFRCPFCEQFFTQTEPQIIKDYVNTGKVKLAFRQYAFLGPASTVAAEAAECANDQGKFWDFHDYLYKNQPPETDTSMYNTDTLTKAATTLGMDGTKFRTCLDTKADDSKVNTDFAEGQKAGVSGTPDFFVNGTPISGAVPYATFKTAIDAELAK